MSDNKRALIKKYAIGAIFSDTAELGFDFIMEKLEEGEIPDEAIVFAPYESLGATELASQVEDQIDTFATFAEQLSELEDEDPIVWQSTVRQSMVEDFTEEQTGQLVSDLDDSVELAFENIDMGEED
jgi:antirestriction protein